MTEEQTAELFNRHLPTRPMPGDVEQRIIDRTLPAVRGLATGRVDPTTGKITITPTPTILAWICEADALDIASAWGFEDGVDGNERSGALHFQGQALDAYNDAYNRGVQMRTRFWGG